MEIIYNWIFEIHKHLYKYILISSNISFIQAHNHFHKVCHENSILVRQCKCKCDRILFLWNCYGYSPHLHSHFPAKIHIRYPHQILLSNPALPPCNQSPKGATFTMIKPWNPKPEKTRANGGKRENGMLRKRVVFHHDPCLASFTT